MFYFDAHADRTLTLVLVMEDEVTADILHVAHHPRNGVGAQRLAHKTDGARLVHDDSSRSADVGAEGFFIALSFQLWSQPRHAPLDPAR